MNTSTFIYQPHKIRVGELCHYLKTNLDGSYPEHIAQFMAAENRLEVFKYHPGGSRAGLVVAEMDWETFSAHRLDSWQQFAEGEKQVVATLNYTAETKAVEVSIPMSGRPPELTPIPFLPFHIYNFDLGSLNIAWRHLARPQTNFVVGIADPTFSDGPFFAYKGEVTITYEGEVVRDGVACWQYAIDGEGLEQRGGHIWVNQEQEYIQDMEIDLPDNPDWDNFKLRLTGVEQMSQEEWEAFCQSQF